MYTEDNMVVCTTCIIKHELDNYDRIKHKDIDSFKCKTCGKTFFDYESLEMHKKGHKDINNFKCETCEKTFFDEDSLEMHKKGHKDRNSFKCEPCGKKVFE